MNALPVSTTDTMPLGCRLGRMAVGWGAVGAVYFSTGYSAVSAQVLPASALDRVVPFAVDAIWLYLAFFAFIPLAYLRSTPVRVRWLSCAMPCCALICGAVYVIHPTTLGPPPAPPTEASPWASWLYAKLLASDSERNCAPSLHAALTLLCVMALWSPARPVRNAGVSAVALGIAGSILVLKRHLFIDLVSGLGVAMVAALIASSCFRHFDLVRQESP
jgi:hypothetical protein